MRRDGTTGQQAGDVRIELGHRGISRSRVRRERLLRNAIDVAAQSLHHDARRRTPARSHTQRDGRRRFDGGRKGSG